MDIAADVLWSSLCHLKYPHGLSKFDAWFEAIRRMVWGNSTHGFLRRLVSLGLYRNRVYLTLIRVAKLRKICDICKFSRDWEEELKVKSEK